VARGSLTEETAIEGGRDGVHAQRLGTRQGEALTALLASDERDRGEHRDERGDCRETGAHDGAYSRVRRVFTRFLWMLLALGACSAAQRPRAAGYYRFRCDPPDARVIVDEEDRGACSLWRERALGLPAGAHRIRVEHEGWLPMEAEVTPAGGVVTVTARLRPVPD
jgi:hypothetical protein